jgi:hypothetical protein
MLIWSTQTNEEQLLSKRCSPCPKTLLNEDTSMLTGRTNGLVIPRFCLVLAYRPCRDLYASDEVLRCGSANEQYPARILFPRYWHCGGITYLFARIMCHWVKQTTLPLVGLRDTEQLRRNGRVVVVGKVSGTTTTFSRCGPAYPGVPFLEGFNIQKVGTVRGTVGPA